MLLVTKCKGKVYCALQICQNLKPPDFLSLLLGELRIQEARGQSSKWRSALRGKKNRRLLCARVCPLCTSVCMCKLDQLWLFPSISVCIVYIYLICVDAYKHLSVSQHAWMHAEVRLDSKHLCLLSHLTYSLPFFFYESGSFIEPGAQMDLVCLASRPQVPFSLHHLVLSLQACTPAPRSLWGFLHSELRFSCKHFLHQAISPASKEKIVSLPLGVEKTTL